MNHSFDELKPLPKYKNLASTPASPPLYTTKIKDSSGTVKDCADPRAIRALVCLMNQHAVIGGAAAHWGGPAAFAEIMSALHEQMFQKENWSDHFHFVNDAGHTENGLYALKALYQFGGLQIDELKKFRSVESVLTGHGEAHLYPEGVYISNGPLGSGLPQAQGLAIADRILNKDRITICALSDGGAMEGEAKEAMTAIPGLTKAGKINPFLLLISDNNTKLSGRIDKDSYSMSPTFDSLENLGWNVHLVDDGHDLQKVYHRIENSLNQLKSDQKPHAIIFKTIKGYGVKSTEESASGGHGYPLKPYDDNLISFLEEIYSGDNLPSQFEDWAKSVLASKPESKSSAGPKRVKVQVGVANALNRASKEGLPIFSLSSDLQGSTGVAGFQKENPGKYLDLGIAESNMISSAIGLSKEGLIPVVDTFAQFAITKGNLPFIMSGLSCAPVVGLFSHTGFQDAADGASHQATTYFAAMSSIPQLDVISLSCQQAAEDLLYEGLKKIEKGKTSATLPNSQVYFYGRETHPVSFNKQAKYEWGKMTTLRTGTFATIVATGPLVEKALEAADQMQAAGKPVTVIDHPFINHPDISNLKDELSRTQGRLLTVEDHQVQGGMGSLLAHTLLLDGYPVTLKSLGIPGRFGRSAYKADHLYAQAGLDAEGIVKTLNNWC
jgi:transketolase